MRFASRAPILLLLLPLLACAWLAGCASVPKDQPGVPSGVRTITSIGDRPLPVQVGEPGLSVVADNDADIPPPPIRADRKISGLVVDRRGEPVANAEVRLAADGRASGRDRRVQTDEAGRFTLSNLRSGADYTVIAESEDLDGGYLTGRVKARAPESRIEIVLEGEGPVRSRRTVAGAAQRRFVDDEEFEPGGVAPARTLNEEDIPERVAPESSGFSRGSRSPDPIEEDDGHGGGWRRGVTAAGVGVGAAAVGRGLSQSGARPNAGRDPLFEADDEPNPLPPAIERPAPRAAAVAPNPAPAPPAGPAPPVFPSEPSRRVADAPPAAPAPRAATTADMTLIDAALSAEPRKEAKPDAAAAPSPPAFPPVEPSASAPPPAAPAEAPREEPPPAAPAPLPDPVAEPPVAAPATTVIEPPPDLPAPVSAPPLGPESTAPAPTPPTTEAEIPPPIASPSDGSLETPAMVDEAPTPGPLVEPPPAAPAELPPAESAETEEAATQAAKPGAVADASGSDGGDETEEAVTQAAKPGAVADASGSDGGDVTGEAVKPRATWGQLTGFPAKPAAVAAAAAAPLAVHAAARGADLASMRRPAITSANDLGPACDFDVRQARLKSFQMPDLEGNPVRFVDLNADYVLLDFWGTWCGPCMKTIPHLVELQRLYGPERLRIVGVAYEQGSPAIAAQSVTNAARRLGINYTLLMGATDGQPCPLRDAFQVRAYPTLVLMDRQGRVLWRDQGANPSTLAQLDRTLAAKTRPQLARR